MFKSSQVFDLLLQRPSRARPFFSDHDPRLRPLHQVAREQNVEGGGPHRKDRKLARSGVDENLRNRILFRRKTSKSLRTKSHIIVFVLLFKAPF
jgi:hypothetical protein